MPQINTKKPDEKKPAKPLIVVRENSPVSNVPDQHTAKDRVFFDGGAPEQVFKFEKWGFSYGTDDKAHAASIFLSLLIASLLILIFVIGAFVDRSWISDAMKVLGTAFTFTIGVAIGKGGVNGKGGAKPGDQ